MRHLREQAYVLVIGTCLPAVSFAEVMDKEPSLAAVWVWATSGTLAGLLGAKVRWWMIFITLPLPLVFYYHMIFGELADPYVGTAIRNEAGEIYVWSIYLGLTLVLLGHVLGFVLAKKQKVRNS